MKESAWSKICKISTTSTFRTKPLPTAGGRHVQVNSKIKTKEEETAPCLFSVNTICQKCIHSHIDPGLLKTAQHQQGNENLHQVLNGNLKKTHRGRLQISCTGQHQEQHLLVRCSVSLNSKHKVQAINRYALCVIRHPAGIIGFPKEEKEVTDIKTRKLPTVLGGFHSKSLRLFTKLMQEGQRKVSARKKNTIKNEATKI